MRRIWMLLGLGLISALVALGGPWSKAGLQAQAPEKKKSERDEVRVTIYNAHTGPATKQYGGGQGYWEYTQDGRNIWHPVLPARAYVKDRREMDIPKGSSKTYFTEVAQQMDVTSVFFKSLDNPKEVDVAEQNYEYDLVSAAKIMEKYIDQEIEIVTKDGTVKGILMSFDGEAIVIKDKETGNLKVVTRQENVKAVNFPKLPEGLITRPTLVWDVEAKKGGKQLVEVSYLTGGLSWQTDYVAVLNDNDTKMDFGAWVTLNNSSGATYADAKLKLVAGDVDTNGQSRQSRRTMTPPPEGAGETPVLAKGTAGRKIGEFYLYDLERRTTLKEKQVKQLSLFPTVKDVPVVKYFLYDGAYYGKKVRTNVKFLNSQGNNLGIPLPMGRVRVSKMDDDRALEFIGEDLVDHTAKDEEIDVFLGNAFDIVGEWKQTNTKKIADRVWEVSYEIKLRNHKEEDAKVMVREHMWGGQWEITEANVLFKSYQKKDAHTVECEVTVPKGGEEAVLTYTVRYTWN